MPSAISNAREQLTGPEPAGVTKYINEQLAAPEAAANHTLALQVLHSLRHEHNWTRLELHTTSPLPPFASLPRPLISGFSPHRLYMHPDEQIELLKEAKKRRTDGQAQKKDELENGARVDLSKAKVSKTESSSGLDLQAEPEREWVLPTRLNEKWSLRRMAEVFDAIGVIPPEEMAESVEKPSILEEGNGMPANNKWRSSKRVLMAIVDHDSAISYYIVQEGIVKPRQN